MNHRSAPAVRYSASLDQVPHPAIQYHPTLVPTPPNNTNNTFFGIVEQPEETLLPTSSANPSTDKAIVASANPGDLSLEPALTSSTSDSLDRSHTPGPSAVAIAKRSITLQKWTIQRIIIPRLCTTRSVAKRHTTFMEKQGQISMLRWQRRPRTEGWPLSTVCHCSIKPAKMPSMSSRMSKNNHGLKKLKSRTIGNTTSEMYGNALFPYMSSYH